MSTASTSSAVVLPPLDDNHSKARYGVAYVRTLCAQAGYGLSETSADEDVLAVDCTLETHAIGIRVQVKCTSRQFSAKRGELSWSVEDHWRKRWEKNLTTLYFVVVRLNENARTGWIQHQVPVTLHHASAYWTAINPSSIPKRLSISAADHLEAGTFGTWELAALSEFGAFP